MFSRMHPRSILGALVKDAVISSAWVRTVCRGYISNESILFFVVVFAGWSTCSLSGLASVASARQWQLCSYVCPQLQYPSFLGHALYRACTEGSVSRPHSSAQTDDPKTSAKPLPWQAQLSVHGPGVVHQPNRRPPPPCALPARTGKLGRTERGLP